MLKRTIPSLCLLFFTTVAFATISVTEHSAYYNISGTTAQQLRTQMDTLGPLDHGQHFAAKTTWYINWSYKFRYGDPVQNSCYVTSVQVSADIIFFMPEWTNMTSADPALQDKWKKYLISLVTHEYGHADNGKRAANEIENALLHFGPLLNCQTLESILNSTAQQIIKQHSNWDVQYDADTQHGKTQGAVFP